MLEKIKDNRKNIIAIVVLMLVLIASILLDVFLAIPSIKNLDALVNVLFSSLIGVTGFWVACYLLFCEIFKGRYQISSFKEEYSNKNTGHLIRIIISLVFGSLIIAFSFGTISSSVFSIFTLYTICSILLEIYNSYKSLALNNQIDDFQKQLKEKLNEGKPLEYKQLKEYSCLFDECIAKEEYYTVQKIVQSSGDIFREFLKNSIGKMTPEETEKSFKSILKFNCMQLRLAKNVKSEILIEKIAEQQYDNLKFCVDYNQTEWYKEYFKSIIIFFIASKSDKNEIIISNKLFAYIFKLSEKLLDLNKKEIAEFTIKEIQNSIYDAKMTHDDAIIENYAVYFGRILETCKDKCYDDWFEKILSDIEYVAQNSYPKIVSFSDFKFCYARGFEYFKKKSVEDALAFCKRTKESFSNEINSPDFAAFKFYCIYELYEQSKELPTMMMKVFEFNIDVLKYSISSPVKPDMLISPRLTKHFLTSGQTEEEIKEIISIYVDLLNTCIIQDEPIHFYKFLECVNEVFISTKRGQKNLHIDLLKIYIWAINRSENLVNKNFYKITFELIENVFFELDKENAISDDFADEIINVFADFAKHTDAENSEIINLSIDLLKNFDNGKQTMRFILKNRKKKEYLYRSLFNVGTSCIENNYEEGVRRVSNALGWAIINTLKSNNTTSVGYIIDRAIDLYKLSNKMDVSIATQTFIVTLFTTVGSYCSKDPSLYQYRTRIIKNLNVSSDLIETAVSLRTKESDTWNDLFENKTEYLTKEFLKAYRKYHKDEVVEVDFQRK